MGAQEEKQKERLKSIPTDYTFREAVTLMQRLGFTLCQKGHTSGSRILFFRERDEAKVALHKPHPGDVMKKYAVEQLVVQLIKLGEIDE